MILYNKAVKYANKNCADSEFPISSKCMNFHSCTLYPKAKNTLIHRECMHSCIFPTVSFISYM